MFFLLLLNVLVHLGIKRCSSVRYGFIYFIWDKTYMQYYESGTH